MQSSENINVLLEEAFKSVNQELAKVNEKITRLENNFNETKLKLKRSQELVTYQEMEIKKLKDSNYEDQTRLSSRDDLEKKQPQFDYLVNKIQKLTSSLESDSSDTGLEDLSDIIDDETQSQLSLITDSFSSLISKLNQTKSQLDQIKLDNESLMEELDEEKLHNELQIIDELKSTIEELREENVELEDRISQALIDNEAKEVIFNELKRDITFYVRENRDLKEKIELFEAQYGPNSTSDRELDVDKSELEEEVEFYRNLLIEKDQEIISLKKKIDIQTEKTENLGSMSEDELLLKLSELELEEANWQDEKKLLLNRLKELEKNNDNISDGESISKEDLINIKETLKTKENIIEALRSEIIDIGQDIDNADDEIDRLTIENENLSRKVTELSEKESEENSEPHGQGDNNSMEFLLGRLLPKEKIVEPEESQGTEELDGTDSIMSAIGNAGVFSSLIDKFLKPSVQVTYLVKQGDWDYESLAETVSVSKKELKKILYELAQEGVVHYDDYKIWWTGKEKEN